MSQHLVELTLPWQDVLFQNHGRQYEHEADWLKEKVEEQWEDCPLIGEDDYMRVIGYQPLAYEEGLIILQVTVELEDDA